MKKVCGLFYGGLTGILLLATWAGVAGAEDKPELLAEPEKETEPTWGHPAGEDCLKCHRENSPLLVAQWEDSPHAEIGVNCMDCHQAGQDDPDAITHHGQTVSTLVSPLDCGRCHEQEYNQHRGSTHAKAARRSKAWSEVLVHRLSGEIMQDIGCERCHGGEVKVLENQGGLDLNTWPDHGIGRLNPDGSRGNCSACHARHRFSKVQARAPETCAKCHGATDAPNWGIYISSSHGRHFQLFREHLKLSGEEWEPGRHYIEAPSCATCHMGGAGSLRPTHDVGMRNAWNLHAPISEQQYLVVLESGDKYNLPVSRKPPRKGDPVTKPDGGKGLVKAVATPERRRQAMIQVCRQCHGERTAQRYMEEFDQAVELYNSKFAQPARDMMQALYATKKLTPAPFDEPLEFTYWKLWHDAGIRARQGAAMSSPQYAWWWGMNQVAELFYGHFLPQAKNLAGEAFIRQHLKDLDAHQWLGKPEQAHAILGETLHPPREAPKEEKEEKEKPEQKKPAKSE